MNKVILMGRLTKEPDVRYSQNVDGSMAIARYTLTYLHQGTKIVVTGRVQTGSYTNKDGQKIYTTDVVVEEAAVKMTEKNGYIVAHITDDSVSIRPYVTDENGNISVK